MQYFQNTIKMTFKWKINIVNGLSFLLFYTSQMFAILFNHLFSQFSDVFTISNGKQKYYDEQKITKTAKIFYYNWNIKNVPKFY